MDEWYRKNYIDVTIDLLKGTKYEQLTKSEYSKSGKSNEVRNDDFRTGFAQEALEAVVQAYFEKTDVVMFTGGHYAYNGASGELLKKCGFTYEGTEHKAMRHAERGPTDLVYYYREK